MSGILIVEDAANICEITLKDCINRENGCENCSVNYIYENIEYITSLHEQGRLIEQKHGRWTGPDGYNCSECGESYMEVADADAYASGWQPNYCPHCGAKMDEE